MSRLDGSNLISVLGLSVLIGLLGYTSSPSLAFAEDSPASESQAQEGQGGVTD